jgi:hypothetical protein
MEKQAGNVWTRTAMNTEDWKKYLKHGTANEGVKSDLKHRRK